MSALRLAVAADLPQMWDVRSSVAENTLTPGRINDAEFLHAIETTGRGWVIEADGQIQAFAVGNALTGNVWALFVRPQAQGPGLRQPPAHRHAGMVSYAKGGIAVAFHRHPHPGQKVL